MKKIIIYIIIVICLITLSISIVQIINWNKDNKKVDEVIDNIKNIVTIEETSTGEIIEQNEIDYNSPYYKYIKMNMINVDFNELKNINSDVLGWIQVNGTNINYPFVQGSDNSFYLDHSIDKSYTQAGWIFLDYRNNIDNINKNTIIYGHNRADESMFGSLYHTLENKWLNNTDNHIIKLSTEYYNTMWQVFSGYRIDTTSDYLQVDFNSDTEYQEFLDKLKNRSFYNFNTSISSNDKILTLSSCYGPYQKTVLHAKLIKIETR